MVEVYIADTNQMESDINAYRGRLTPERWERANRFLFLKDRLLCAAAGLLLRSVLGVKTGGALVQGSYGKPALAAGGREFNLSHSGRYCILAVGEAPLGADIERIGPSDDAVAKKCYTESELAYLHGKNGGEDERFAVLWTRKESLMKATGMGLHLPPESFCVAPVSEPACRINGQCWHFKQYEPGAEYMITVCAGQEDFASGLCPVQF